MPIHTVYVGAHEFDAGMPRRFMAEAADFFAAVFPTPEDLADRLDLAGDLAADGPLAEAVHGRIARRLSAGKLSRVIEDLRIDFEDGYGQRSDAEEDRDADRCAAAVLEARSQGDLPPGNGLRIRSMAEPTRRRSLATLERFAGPIAGEFGQWPEGFVVTLAKIDHVDEVTRFIAALEDAESRWGLEAGAIPIELMAETPRSIYDGSGQIAVPAWLEAAKGRCVGIHLGVYDYTAALGIVAGLQGPRHPSCDVARGVLQVALAGTGVELSDGSSRLIPRQGAQPQDLETAIRTVAQDIEHALTRAIYRGWDMAPSHTAIRWLVTTAFFLRHLPEMNERLATSTAESKEASESGSAAGGLEDAATWIALRTFFRRGLECGALEAKDLPAGVPNFRVFP